MESDIIFILNNQVIRTKINPATILLDFIRKKKKLTSTKEVCKEGDCGACAILLGSYENGSIKYKTINSCLYPIQKVFGKHVVTLEGLQGTEISLIQKSFINEGASQCGFCTPGFIISLTGYLLNTSKFDETEAINSIAGNICRCTGYHSIIRSIINIGKFQKDVTTDSLSEHNIIPKYFNTIPDRLAAIHEKHNEPIKFSASNHKIVSGGTDLFVQQPEELLSKNIELIDNLVKPYINILDEHIIISGSATIDDLQQFIENNIDLNLKKLFKLFASLPIRNSATIAGNIINASPIADFTITMLALKAKVTLVASNKSSRVVELYNLFKGYKSLNMNESEFIKEIHFKIPESDSFFNFEKVSKRTHLDIASVNTAILLSVEGNNILDASISAGGIAPIPLILKDSSKFLLGKTINHNTLLNLFEIVNSEISPINDIRGSKEYKALLLKQLIKAHFITLSPHIVSDEVLYV